MLGPKDCARFCVPLDQKPSHLVAMRQGSKSPVLAWKINTIANGRTQWEDQAPQPLTEEVLVRSSPGTHPASKLRVFPCGIVQAPLDRNRTEANSVSVGHLILHLALIFSGRRWTCR